MSCELLSDPDKTFSLDVCPKRCILKGELLNSDGDKVESSLDLNGFIGNHDGKFAWGGGKFSKTAAPGSITLNEYVLTATLQCRAGNWHENQIDLSKHIYNIDGRFTYLTARPSHEPECMITAPGLLLDGNIDAATFAVASDRPGNRCRIAYKTSIDDNISLAEVAFNGKSWALPSQIDVFPNTVPGKNLAFAYHPDDAKTRSLFFSEENGNGYIYQQAFNPDTQEWNKPAMLKSNKRAEGLKAHRFTKYAATYYRPKDTARSSRLLLYYVDESNLLQESIGTQDRNSKKWYWRSTSVVSSVLAKSFLAVSQRGEKTFLLYRDLSLNLCLLVGSKRDAKLGKATWDSENPIILRSTHELLKDSPLAITARSNGNTVTTFFVQRDGQQKIIFSIDHNPGSNFRYSPRRVGKMEPDSILGAASFPNNPLYDARQFSVSNLDGDNILVERIPKYYTSIKGAQQWVLSGGVIDTDVNELEARVQDPEDTDSE